MMIEYVNEDLNTCYLNPSVIKVLVPSTRPDICACYIIVEGEVAIKSHTPIDNLNQQMRDWFQSDDYRHRALGGGDYAQRRVDQLEGLIRYLLGTVRGLDDDLARFIEGKLTHELNNPPFSERSESDA